MKSSKKQRPTNGDRRTKAELLDALAEAENLAQSLMNELAECKIEMKPLEKKVDTLTKQNKRLESIAQENLEAEKNLRKLTQHMNKIEEEYTILEKRSKTLEKEFQEANRVKQESEGQQLAQQKKMHEQEKAISVVHGKIQDIEKEKLGLEKELVSLQKKNTELEEEIQRLEQMKTKWEKQDALREVEQVKQDIEKELAAKEKTNAALKSKIQNIEKDKSALKSEMNAQKKINSKLQNHIREMENKQSALEKELAARDKANSELLDKLGEYEQQDAGNDLPAAKSVFRIDLYPRQGHFHGRIEHVLSKDKKTFSWKDQNEVISFISNHLPRIEESVEVSEPPIIPESVQKETVEEPVVTAEPAEEVVIPPKQNIDDVPSVLEHQITPSIAIKPGGVVPHNQAFQVRVALTQQAVEAAIEELISYTASIYAKPMHGGQKQFLCEGQGTTKASGSFAVDVEPNRLPPGTYRLDAFLSFRLAEGVRAPIGAYKQTGILQIS